MTRTGTLHRAAMLAAITVAKVNVFERLLMRKKLARLAAILALLLSGPCMFPVANAAEGASWFSKLARPDMDVLIELKSRWGLESWDFSDPYGLYGVEVGPAVESRREDGTPTLYSGSTLKVRSISLYGTRATIEGSLPDYLGNLSDLESLSVAMDKVTGPIPESLGKLSWLQELELGGLTGEIPSSLGKLSKLRKLTLWGDLTGAIPSSLGNLSMLRELTLRGDLTGAIPSSLGSLSFLRRLDLAGNNLTGPIPDFLGELMPDGVLVDWEDNWWGSPAGLRYLDLSHNNLTGPIPTSLALASRGNLSQKLVEWGNYANVGDYFYQLHFPNCRLTIDLSHNNLTGPVPAFLLNLEQLRNLDLSSNQLTGRIPRELASAKSPIFLSIQENFLTIDRDERDFLWELYEKNGHDIDVEPQGIPPVFQVTTIHPALAEALSNREGGINEPLVPVTDTNVLKDSTATAINGGLVCDGVTPLLFKVTADKATAATTWLISASAVNGGTVRGGLRSRLHVLADGTWQAANGDGVATLTLPPAAAGETTSESYGYIGAIAAEDLTLNAGHTATVEISVQQFDEVLSQAVGTAKTVTFGLRKPPVVLVHGFNSSNGTWGPEFLAQLYKTRSTDFVLPVEYGTGSDPVDNTTGRFDQLAQILDGKLTSQIESAAAERWPDWAWTRYDAVGHSQGGVLLRMLCTKSPADDFLAAGFRSALNFQRGRFNRIITIGSPHNGSLVLHACLKMGYDKIPVPPLQKLLQKKFDPFASGDNQIAQINHPAYKIDQEARFHLIRTFIPTRLVDFWSEEVQPSPWVCTLLCYDQVTAGSSPDTVGTVLLQGRGLDGIVDFDSQGGGEGTPFSEVSGGISHSGPAWLFNVAEDSTQTASAAVGQRVIELLDGGEFTTFGQFITPAPLTSERQSRIDAALSSASLSRALIKRLTGTSDQRSTRASSAASATSSYSFSLTPDPENPLQGEVAWAACVYGPGGTTTDGVTVEVNANDSKEVTVTVDSDVQGDVVLYGSYFSTNGKMAFVPPALVVSRPPDSKLVSLSLKPNKASLQPGDTVPLEVWGTYDNNSTAQLFVPVSQTSPFSFVTSAPSVATVDGNGLVTAVGQGPATIAVTYEGLSATFPVTVNAGVAVITSQPADATTSVGGAASFSVGAAGSGLTYQWYANGTPVAGATSPTLSLNNVQPNQQGDYWVAVKNSSGTVLGNAARLAVEGVPPPTTPAPSTSPDLADAPEGISLVSFIPQSRAVKAGKTARSVKLMVMLSNNSLENVPVTVALSAEPAGIVTLPQSSMEMTVPGKKSAKQKAKTMRRSFTVLVPPTASGDVTIKASVGALSASSTLRVQAVKR